VWHPAKPRLSRAATRRPCDARHADTHGHSRVVWIHSKALEESVRTHGVQVPVIVDENGTTVDGHHRAEIANRLGVGHRTDVKTGPSDEEKRALAFKR